MSVFPVPSGPNPTGDAPARPPCPECADALDPVGGGRHLYWSCRWCGALMPRT